MARALCSLVSVICSPVRGAELHVLFSILAEHAVLTLLTESTDMVLRARGAVFEPCRRATAPTKRGGDAAITVYGRAPACLLLKEAGDGWILL